jgi:hypothetical protein
MLNLSEYTRIFILWVKAVMEHSEVTSLAMLGNANIDDPHEIYMIITVFLTQPS